MHLERFDDSRQRASRGRPFSALHHQRIPAAADVAKRSTTALLHEGALRKLLHGRDHGLNGPGLHRKLLARLAASVRTQAQIPQRRAPICSHINARWMPLQGHHDGRQRTSDGGTLSPGMAVGVGASADVAQCSAALLLNHDVTAVGLQGLHRGLDCPHLRRCVPSLDAVRVPANAQDAQASEGVRLHLWRGEMPPRSHDQHLQSSGLDSESLMNEADGIEAQADVADGGATGLLDSGAPALRSHRHHHGPQFRGHFGPRLRAAFGLHGQLG
mmetsp:Transcript_129869/g.415402  ORF Transcript_129869/g.415402 Transcript_129869/m.415402 type:complete len:272 (+) Transcript_129869:196-1011(+)